MPGAAHETLVALLQQRPDLLDLLLLALGRPALGAKLEAKDSAVRVANPLEVRPDLVLVAEGERGPWVIVEVQLGRDDDKPRRWLAAAGALLDARGAMGDVVVITHDASLARWAADVALVVGPGGTRLGLEPVVVQLTLPEAERLIATGRAELAMFAAWAVHDQRGREAQAIVRRAVTAIDATPDPELRDELARAMLSMLGEPLLAVVREMMMSPLVIPESAGFKALKREIETLGRVAGEVEALLTVIAARKLPLDDASRVRIEQCTDPARLTRWIARAVTAGSVEEVFADDAE